MTDSTSRVRVFSDDMFRCFAIHCLFKTCFLCVFFQIKGIENDNLGYSLDRCKYDQLPNCIKTLVEHVCFAITHIQSDYGQLFPKRTLKVVESIVSLLYKCIRVTCTPFPPCEKTPSNLNPFIKSFALCVYMIAY